MASSDSEDAFVWRVSFVRQTTGQEWSGYGVTLAAAIDNLRRLAAQNEERAARDAQLVREGLARVGQV